jgi:hypothetical protein
MTLKGGFDFLGQLLFWVKRPDAWMAMSEYTRRDMAEMYGTTAHDLERMILDWSKTR